MKLIFRRYSQVGSAKKVAAELNEQGYKTKSWTTKKGKERVGAEWNTAQVYRLLNNRLYIGEVAYKGKNYPGEHEALIDMKTWDKVQALLSGAFALSHPTLSTRKAGREPRQRSPLSGVIRCGHCDSAMGITYTNKGDRRYSYYICEKDTKRAVSQCPIKRIPAGDIEKVVIEQFGAVFRTPTAFADFHRSASTIEAYFSKCGANRVERHARRKALKLMRPIHGSHPAGVPSSRPNSLSCEFVMSPDNNEPDRNSRLLLVNQEVARLTKYLGNVSARLKVIDAKQISEGDVSEALQSVETFWEDLFPLERNRLIQLLVETIEIRETGIDMELRTNVLTNLVSELVASVPPAPISTATSKLTLEAQS